MKVVIISQARMTSTRLPGKVLKEVLGKPLLEYHLERLRQSTSAHQVVLATTVEKSDEPIVRLCNRLHVTCIRGSEHDVLSRYHDAAQFTSADVVVRVTSDCPVIDPAVIDQAVERFLSGSFDYVSNTLVRSYPRGMDVEVFSAPALQEAYEEAVLEFQREHVTPFIYQNPQRFRLGNISLTSDMSQYRWTVDTEEDFTLVRKIIEELAPKSDQFTLGDITRVLEANEHWNSINAHIEQKKLGQ